ncbi:MAG: segregation/condensation protein A [Candidatus Aenigmatarchaeota archaeon]
MEKEENILQLILEKENWEEIIYHIVSIEKLDPWNIDLIKLTDSFINYLKRIEELDFRIPARVVFVAVVLLKLKADYLSIFEEEETIEQIAQQQPIDLGIDPNLIQLGIPIKRIPRRQITLDELILALRKAISVRERRIERKIKLRERIVLEISEEDISKRIEEMMREIEEMMEKMKSGKIGFSQIVGEWKRERVVEKFIPLLHLDNDGKIETEQEDYFKEIWIRKTGENKP